MVYLSNAIAVSISPNSYFKPSPPHRRHTSCRTKEIKEISKISLVPRRPFEVSRPPRGMIQKSMEAKRKDAIESVSRIRHLLADWLRSSTESREPVAEILTLLESVDSFIRGEWGRQAGESKPERDGARSRGGATYTVEKKKNEVETLTEHREGGSSQPYRVPKYIYDATVNVLAEAESPLDFEEVVKGVAATLPEPPEWQVRAVLRFLLNAAPPLVVRERKKYRPLNPKKIAAEAKAAWNALAKASK